MYLPKIALNVCTSGSYEGERALQLYGSRKLSDQSEVLLSQILHGYSQQYNPGPLLCSSPCITSFPSIVIGNSLQFSLGTDTCSHSCTMRLKCAITEPSNRNSLDITTRLASSNKLVPSRSMRSATVHLSHGDFMEWNMVNTEQLCTSSCWNLYRQYCASVVTCIRLLWKQAFHLGCQDVC